MKITIGELSKIFGLTGEALRYYEKNGILSPQRDSTNRYRYYSSQDVQKIGTIKKLRNADYSLQDIKQLFEGITDAEYSDLSGQRMAELERETEFKLAVLQRMRHCHNIFIHREQLLRKCKVVQSKSFYRYDFKDIDKLIQNKESLQRASSWFRYMPLVNASSRVPLSTLKRQSDRFSKGLIISKKLAEQFELDVSEPVEEIESCRCIYVILYLEDMRFEQDLWDQCLLPFIEENQLQPADHAFTRSITSYKDINRKYKLYSELFIPLV